MNQVFRDHVTDRAFYFYFCTKRRVFDFARSIDAHQDSTAGTHVTSGLIGLNDEVTWEARHLGLKQRLSVRVTAFSRPRYFQDIMVADAFKSMKHDHEFFDHPRGTRMVDRFAFQSPLRILGRVVDQLFLRSYMQQFLVHRNGILKNLAESKEWGPLSHACVAAIQEARAADFSGLWKIDASYSRRYDMSPATLLGM